MRKGWQNADFTAFAACVFSFGPYTYLKTKLKKGRFTVLSSIYPVLLSLSKFLQLSAYSENGLGILRSKKYLQIFLYSFPFGRRRFNNVLSLIRQSIGLSLAFCKKYEFPLRQIFNIPYHCLLYTSPGCGCCSLP